MKTNANINTSCVSTGTKRLLSPSCYLPATPAGVFPLDWGKSCSSYHLGLERTTVWMNSEARQTWHESCTGAGKDSVILVVIVGLIGFDVKEEL